jgi:hypothetical protein
MKNLIFKIAGVQLVIRFFVMGIFVVGTVGAAQAQPPTHPRGFMSRLIEIKYSTELYLSQALKKENGKSQTAIDSTIAIYNTLRWKVDGLVYQLSAEMIARNSPALLRQLDNWSYREEIRAKGLIKHYVASIKEIEQLYKEVVMPAINPIQNRTLNLTTNVFYLLKDSYSIIKGLSDLKTRKVMALVELLDHVRLLGPGEVGKMASSK